jgi:hypothetical protein
MAPPELRAIQKLFRARSQLVSKPQLLFTTTKQRRGIGDIDLGVYEMESRVLLLCEIKTVFDRFRTNFAPGRAHNRELGRERIDAQISPLPC